MQPAPEWSRVEISGSVHAAVFPAICVHCAQPVAERVPIDRLNTWEVEDDGLHWEVLRLRIPLCPRCAARHKAELKRVPAWDRIRPAIGFEILLGFLGPFLFSVFLAYQAGSQLLRGDGAAVAIFAIGGALFGFVSLIVAFRVLRRSRRFGVPPDTSVSASFKVSKNRADLFDPERRRFQFRNPAYAAAFRKANQGSLWTTSSARAVNAAAARTLLIWAAMAACVIYVLWAVYDEFLR